MGEIWGEELWAPSCFLLNSTRPWFDSHLILDFCPNRLDPSLRWNKSWFLPIFSSVFLPLLNGFSLFYKILECSLKSWDSVSKVERWSNGRLSQWHSKDESIAKISSGALIDHNLSRAPIFCWKFERNDWSMIWGSFTGWMGGFGGVVNSERRDVASSYSGGSETLLPGKCIALRMSHNNITTI